jgi:26S proteasome regulatory subunit N2
MATLGYISLLEEGEADLKEYALKSIDAVVDVSWASVADSVEKLALLARDADFEHQKLAALVTSKVYYHLDEIDNALDYALAAGELFDVTADSQYVSTLVAQAIDTFVSQRAKQWTFSSSSSSSSSSFVEAGSSNAVVDAVDDDDEEEEEEEQDNGVAVGDGAKIDGRLLTIVENMFSRCFDDGRHKEALGVALEARWTEKIHEALSSAADVGELLSYAFDVCMKQVTCRDFRQTVFALLVDVHRAQESPDYGSIVKILVFLGDSVSVAGILDRLLASAGGDAHLLAYQLAFDLCDLATQRFLTAVIDRLPKSDAAEASSETGSAAGDDGDDAKSPSALSARRVKLGSILRGEISLQLYIDFLAKNNRTDLLILKNIKESLEVRNPVCHNATVFAHTIMQAGTTKDTFLRENLEWLGRATHWAKFSATAGLGVIHKGQVKRAMSLLQGYLPAPGSTGGPYCEGGALYALGLIHANHGADAVPYLVEELQSAMNKANEIMMSGACLGLGVAAMATDNEAIYAQLHSVLRSEEAVAGEAAGIAMGLVMLGSASQQALMDMINHAHLTEHEKIIRGLAIGCALTMYGREEQADTLIETLLRDKDPILRYGGMFTIGLAYCGTANNDAIRRLLHVAVSDVSDDVRRAAVLALGFLLFRQPEQCPKLVALLAGSYNPHVRYGATIAVGISCAGTGLQAAIDLLEPMLSDDVDFVRQGACIAIALVLMQTSEAQNPSVKRFRALFAERIGDKHEELMAKFGAILASGLIDAGGRNVTVALQSRSGHLNLSAIVGLAIFVQYWYWYPLTHFVSLAFTPTAVIGLNDQLDAPQWQMRSNAAPSLFAYPEPYKPPVTEAPVALKTAVLSTAKRAQARAQQKLRAGAHSSGASAAVAAASSSSKSADSKKKDNGADASSNKDGDSEATADEKEPDHAILSNPARVTPTQLGVLQVEADSRWQPVVANRIRQGGIIILRDERPDEPIVLASSSPAQASGKDDKQKEDKDEDEPAPPEAFEWAEDDE